MYKIKAKKELDLKYIHSVYTFDKYDNILRHIFYADKDLCVYYHLLQDLEEIKSFVNLERKLKKEV